MIKLNQLLNLLLKKIASFGKSSSIPRKTHIGCNLYSLPEANTYKVSLHVEPKDIQSWEFTRITIITKLKKAFDHITFENGLKFDKGGFIDILISGSSSTRLYSQLKDIINAVPSELAL